MADSNPPSAHEPDALTNDAPTVTDGLASSGSNSADLSYKSDSPCAASIAGSSDSLWTSANWVQRGLLVVVVLMACWLRAPRVGEGLPFFDREDEAHHFNRLAEMVKEGRLDPEYFHKPSLHFYLRMPIFGASFLWGVREGHLKSVQEVVTRDRYGIAGYAFSASHPGLVKGSRLFTLALGIIALLLSISIAWQLSHSISAALLTGALVASSPPLISEGAVIGVDILMMTMCVWCVWIAVSSHRREHQIHGNQNRTKLLPLLGCGVVAGLAVSSKYNAAPIILVPLLWCLLSYGITLRYLALLGATIALGFFVGTPFSLAHIPQFLDQVAYEVWHYGVVGHVGHMATPGFEQFRFYLEWMNTEALGSLVTVLGFLGALTFLKPPRNRHILFLAFPLVFFALMLSQKTNFTRNMLVFLPFMCVSAAVGVHRCVEWLRLKPHARRVLLVSVCGLCLAFPLWKSLAERRSIQSHKDSRVFLLEKLPQIEQQSPFEQIAIAGQLQLPVATFAIGPLARFNQVSEPLLSLYQQGFSLFATYAALGIRPEESKLFTARHIIPGHRELRRVVDDPKIDILGPVPGPALDDALEQYIKQVDDYRIEVILQEPAAKNCHATRVPPGSPNATHNSEAYCWLAGRVSFLDLTDFASALRAAPSTEFITLSLELMSPWNGNAVDFSSGSWHEHIALPTTDWNSITLRVPLGALRSSPLLTARTAIVRSPRLQGLSEDPRSLGVAVRNIRLR